jgi:sulfide:quinone oxidoreductase
VARVVRSWLIWLPFGKRNAADITFALKPTFDAHGINFVHAEATAIDPAARTVATASHGYGYDYLVSLPASAISSTSSRAWA